MTTVTCCQTFPARTETEEESDKEEEEGGTGRSNVQAARKRPGSSIIHVFLSV
ncbi:GL26076 [Drosophila persimilis]|uniref:GL26076 n=1 Tax=Drosophila persimilis TaxID=7234 RepID=B4GKG2_DROPE|nr:GL26076 [Drosophila persimilis]